MAPREITPFDPKRLIVGDQPAAFLGEIVVRAIITYAILLLATRLLGKRVAGQMSVLELTIITTLGAAIGVPLETPERGMLAAVVVLAVAVAYQQIVGRLTFRSVRAGRILEGPNERLVCDGVIQLKTLHGIAVSRERLFAMIRQQQVFQLGQVARAYIEANGLLTLVRREHPRPGLVLLPPPDRELCEQRFPVAHKIACRSCGHAIDGEVGATVTCEVCTQRDWAPAVERIEIDRL